MSTGEWASVRCRGPLALRHRWYRALADAVAATAPPGGLLLEASLEEPVPWITVRPASLIETVQASPGVRGVGLERSSTPSSPAPPEGGDGYFRSLIASPPATPPPTPCGVDRDLPDLQRLGGPNGWVGFQTAWLRGRDGGIAISRRFRVWNRFADELERRGPALDAAVTEEWADATGVAVTAVPAPPATPRDWRRGALRAVPVDAWLRVPLGALARTAEIRRFAGGTGSGGSEGHQVVFGASGAGKTTFLAHEAARHLARGNGLVVLDLHGDLAPAILGRLDARTRARVLAVDASTPPVAGIAALVRDGAAEDRAAAHLVAALKRLSPDGTELHWGFRLERIFDSFVRLVQEAGGSLVDLYGLLTEPARRDAARLATRRADLARFLEELEPVVKRQPDFLWSAATRLSKVVLVPSLTELLAPSDGGLDVEARLEEGRALLLRLPFALLGPEAASFAGTLVLARTYLGLAARRGTTRVGRPILFVLDEAHSFAPRLVAELLTESRKFGLRVLVATQYPDRLPLELRNAVGGALGDVVAFAIPRRSARTVGEWVGLSGEEAERWLPTLPPGHGVRLDPDWGLPRAVAPAPMSHEPAPDDWAEALARTRSEFGTAPDLPDRASVEDRATDRLLLMVLGATEEGRAVRESEAVGSALRPPGSETDPELLRTRWSRAVADGLLTGGPDRGYRLSAAGERRLGVTAPTHATRESDEHRRLIVATFRIFAHRGYRIEVVRQGRFDTTLPDALYRQLPRETSLAPWELGAVIEQARQGWAWRCFGGRDVHIEAEVSGALRPERIRHGWRKASARRAFALFVVGDAARARKVRATLRALGLGPDRAQVWTLKGAFPSEGGGGVAR